MPTPTTQTVIAAPSTSDLSRTFAWGRRQALLARLSVTDGAPVRRSIDILAGLAGLLVLAPVFLVAALAVRLTSRGNVFFFQERIGHRGKKFMMPKFRTMVVNAEALKAALAASGEGVNDALRFKMKRDPRITRVGRLLRKLSIDELPQLALLVTGKMSLLGPRPAIAKEVNLYSPRALRRLEVKPGLTCLWQVSGRSDLSFDEQVELDIKYIDTVTVWGEITIVLRTIPAVLCGRGAY